jgi:hypothetical protein
VCLINILFQHVTRSRTGCSLRINVRHKERLLAHPLFAPLRIGIVVIVHHARLIECSIHFSSPRLETCAFDLCTIIPKNRPFKYVCKCRLVIHMFYTLCVTLAPPLHSCCAQAFPAAIHTASKSRVDTHASTHPMSPLLRIQCHMRSVRSLNQSQIIQKTLAPRPLKLSCA